MFEINETHDASLQCAVESANVQKTDFPIQNLPVGIFRREAGEALRGGVAIGDQVLDLAVVCTRGWLSGAAAEAAQLCVAPQLNALMAAGHPAWSALRLGLSRLLRKGEAPADLADALSPQSHAEMAMPAAVGDYTDFYTSYEHASNAGALFRPENPLFPNFKHLPIAYHGRSSSLAVSGTNCKRPHGQTVTAVDGPPSFEPTRRLDYELELGVFVGPGNVRGASIALDDAWQHIFGLCLLNDWSARDIQRWEAQPLGPFAGKNFLTSISPWVVMQEALVPFSTAWRPRSRSTIDTLPYLQSDTNARQGAIDIQVGAAIKTPKMRADGGAGDRISHAAASQLYWTVFQMLAHHTANGCNLRSGDLFGTGTISAATPTHSGCLLEVTANGSKPFELSSGETRTFLEDGDEVILTAACERDGFRRIGFGECRGVVAPAA